MADILPFPVPHGCGRPVVQPELAEHDLEQNLDRPGTYIEFPRDRLVRPSRSGQQAEYVALAGRQVDLAGDVILLGWMSLCVAVGFFIAWTAR
jgi:hypothetical protein